MSPRLSKNDGNKNPTKARGGKPGRDPNSRPHDPAAGVKLHPSDRPRESRIDKFYAKFGNLGVSQA